MLDVRIEKAIMVVFFLWSSYFPQILSLIKISQRNPSQIIKHEKYYKENEKEATDVNSPKSKVKNCL